MWFNFIGLVLLQSVVFASDFEGCDNSYSINTSRDISLRSPNFPQSYRPGSKCIYKFFCPEGYSIKVSCDLNVYKTQNCATDKFLISTDNDKQLRGAYQYCGQGAVVKESEYNQLAIAYTSTSSGGGGTFNCTVSVKVQPCDCGWSQTGRIVGGTNADNTEFPSIVAIGVKNGSTIFCDGTIISSRCVVTAAHCTRLYPNANDYFVLAGYNYLSSSVDAPYGNTYGVQKINEHPSYNSYTQANDIAILITSSDMAWSRGLGPVCLPLDTSSMFEYSKVYLSGWGTTSLGGPRSISLQKATVYVNTNSDCKQYYTRSDSSQMCTYTAGKDACQYDSGGPVYYKGSSRMYLLGIISAGIDCGGKSPGLNIRTTTQISWIRQNCVSSLCYKPFQ